MAVLLSLGSVHVDVQVRLDDDVPGTGTVLARDPLRAPGGKAGNVALLAARLGAEVRLLGCVGTDAPGDLALSGPRDAGVDVGATLRRSEPTGQSIVLTRADGDKAIVLALGANDAWGDAVGHVVDQVSTAPPGSVLVADVEVPATVVEAAVRTARRRGLCVVLDPAPPERVPAALLDDPALVPDHVVPDHREAAELTGIDASSVEGAVAAAEALRDRGVAFAHVKLADGGCASAGGDGTFVVGPGPEAEVVDTTGAGDAFAGALGWALVDGRKASDAVRLGVAAAWHRVQVYGSVAEVPTLAELEHLAGQLDVERR